MTRDEHKGIVNELLTMVNPDNQANASDLLTQLTDDYEQTLAGLEQANANVTTLTANNETLREVNARLFLRVGEPSGGGKITEPEPPKDDPKLTFEDLFNEKGELK
mgnify:CR=1 FL=1